MFVGCLLVVWTVYHPVSHHILSRTWQYDSASYQVFQFIERHRDHNRIERCRIGSSWVLVESQNFYRIPAVVPTGWNPCSGIWIRMKTVTITMWTRQGVAVKHPIPHQWFFHDPVSGVVVGVPSPGIARSPPVKSEKQALIDSPARSFD